MRRSVNPRPGSRTRGRSIGSTSRPQHCTAIRPDDEATRSWPLTSDIGGFALTGDGGAVVALRQGLFRLDLDSGALHLLAPPPFDPALFRFYEGACDADERFWIGVMFDPLKGSPPVQRGRLRSFTFGEGLRDKPDAAELHNGMAWSGDGKTFFLLHSNSGEIVVAFDHDGKSGVISNRRVFATVPVELGIPAGAAIETEGGFWSALHGGGKLRRFHPDGSINATSTYWSASRQCPRSRARTSRRASDDVVDGWSRSHHPARSAAPGRCEKRWVQPTIIVCVPQLEGTHDR